MNSDPARAWEGLLDDDEKILWQGKPVTRFAFRPTDFLLSGFGLVFFAFAIFWTVMASSMSSGTGPFGYIFPLFGIPFILVGGFLLFGRFFWDVHRRSRTWYTLMDKRAFIATNLLGNRTLKNYTIDEDSPIVLVGESSEQTVHFAERVKRGSKGNTYTEAIGFELLPDNEGREVYGMLREIRNRSRGPSEKSDA